MTRLLWLMVLACGCESSGVASKSAVTLYEGPNVAVERIDDASRGVSCYLSYRGISCVPMPASRDGGTP